jgi:large subunit ribosomal protein L1
MPTGRKFAAARERIDSTKLYAPDEALALATELSFTKFDETVEIHMRLSIDPRHSDQQVRDKVLLPRGLGRSVTVLVIAEGDDARLAQGAGADYVGSDDMLEKIEKEDWFDYDVIIAVPEMMGKVGKMGRVLGPRGLMPNPKADTVVRGEDLPRAIEDSKAGSIEFRNDKTGNLHVPIGKVSMGADALLENFSALIDAVRRSRPPSSKGTYMRKIVVTTTMGPSIKIDPVAAINLVVAA